MVREGAILLSPYIWKLTSRMINEYGSSVHNRHGEREEITTTGVEAVSRAFCAEIRGHTASLRSNNSNLNGDTIIGGITPAVRR